MKFLNAQQLAFILDIKKEDARVKMVHAWCKSKAINNTLVRDRDTGKIIKTTDDYPLAMPIELLSEQLNLPTLQSSVDDIETNYLNRAATKKWILCDYPEKQVAKCAEEGKLQRLSIPAALHSLLPKETREIIAREWNARFPKAVVKI
jgi:hypothetical protein